MPTQTGSIDLKATGGFKTYAEAQFATSEQVTTLNAAIEQNARDIILRATKEEASQMAQPNLSPYFSSSPYNRTSNSYWYGMGVNSNYTFTDMGDGWMRVQCTNSGSSVIRVDWYPIKCPSVVAGQPYTWLAEVRNNRSTKHSSAKGSDFYLVQTNNNQFWGQKAIKTLNEAQDGVYANTSVTIDIGLAGKTVEMRKVQNAETASDGHWTNNDEASVVGLACWTFRCAANSTIDYEVRLSLYEGEYTGPYKPYVGSQLYASQAELKVTNDSISSKVSTTDYNGQTIASLINQSADSVVIEAEHIELNGTTVFNTIKSSLDSNYDAKGAAQTVQNNLNNNTRSCLVGQSGSTTTNPWYKVASTTIAGQYVDVIAVFDVFNSGGFGAVDRSGRLTVHARAGTGVNSVERPEATWESRGVGVVLSDFVLAYKLTAGSKIDVELWCRCPYAYTGYLFKVVYEGNRTAVVPNTWTLYNTWTAGSQSAVTSGYTQVVSTDVNAAQATADAAAPKAQAVKRTQRIWYRKSVAGAPATPGTASSNWVVKADDGSNAWTKMHVAISSTEKFIYTCEQYEMANGTIGYTSVLLDNTITVIDGGTIITNSVTANQIAASTITGEEIAANTIDGNNIKGSTITAEHLSSAFSLDLGKVEGLKERLESVEQGVSGVQTNTQWVHFDQSVGTVFGREGSANNVTITNEGIDFNTDEGRAAWATGGVFHANEMEADTVDTRTVVMGDWALVQSGTTFYIDYIGS